MKEETRFMIEFGVEHLGFTCRISVLFAAILVYFVGLLVSVYILMTNVTSGMGDHGLVITILSTALVLVILVEIWQKSSLLEWLMVKFGVNQEFENQTYGHGACGPY